MVALRNVLIVLVFLGLAKLFFQQQTIEINDTENIEKKSGVIETFVLYSKKTCIYCVMAEDLLKKNELPYKVIEISDKINLRAKLTNATKHRTVPYVYHGDKFIGGFTELKSYIKNNVIKNIEEN